MRNMANFHPFLIKITRVLPKPIYQSYVTHKRK